MTDDRRKWEDEDHEKVEKEDRSHPIPLGEEWSDDTISFDKPIPPDRDKDEK